MIIFFYLSFSMTRDKRVLSVVKEVIISFSKQFTYVQVFPSRIKNDNRKLKILMQQFLDLWICVFTIYIDQILQHIFAPIRLAK